MFYTIASKIPILSGKNNFLTVFLLGSLAYVLLHYYLWANQQIDIVEKAKVYLYYVIFVDLAIAYFLSRGGPDDTDEEKPYTTKEKKEVENDLLDLKKSRQTDSETYKQKMLQLQQEQYAQQQYQIELARQQLAQQAGQQSGQQINYQSNQQSNQQYNQQYNQQTQADNNNTCSVSGNCKTQQNEPDDSQSATGSNHSPFKTIKQIEDERRMSDESKRKQKKYSKHSKHIREESTTSESSSSSEQPKKVLKKKKTKPIIKKETDDDEIDEDTNIPIYKGK